MAKIKMPEPSAQVVKTMPSIVQTVGREAKRSLMPERHPSMPVKRPSIRVCLFLISTTSAWQPEIVLGRRVCLEADKVHLKFGQIGLIGAGRFEFDYIG